MRDHSFSARIILKGRHAHQCATQTKLALRLVRHACFLGAVHAYLKAICFFFVRASLGTYFAKGFLFS